MVQWVADLWSEIRFMAIKPQFCDWKPWEGVINGIEVDSEKNVGVETLVRPLFQNMSPKNLLPSAYSLEISYIVKLNYL